MVTRWNVDVNGYLYNQDDIRITSMIRKNVLWRRLYEVIVIGDVIEMLKREFSVVSSDVLQK